MNKEFNIEEILKNNKIISIIGFSDNHIRPSNRIGRYLLRNGYKVYGVNPKLNGKMVNEINCYASLKDVPEKTDIVNIFRRSEYVYDIVKEILELSQMPKVIWTQIGVISQESSELAVSNGLIYIENRCIMVEHANI